MAEHIQRRSGHWSPRHIALFTLAVGLMVTFGVWLAAGSFLKNRAQDRLEVQAETLIEAIERAATDVEGNLRAVAGLFEASDTVMADDFQTMVERIEPEAGLGGIAYAPLVPAGELEALVEGVDEEGDYSVFELDADGNHVPVDRRPSYFPVRYFYPDDVIGPPGFDVASVPSRMPYIRQAIDSKQVITTPVTSVAIFDEAGYVVYQPILSAAGDAVGLVVGPVLVERLIDSAVVPALAAAVDWTMVTDESGSDRADGLKHVAEATIGTQSWLVEVRPASGSPILTDAWRPAALLGAALAISSIVAAIASFWFWKETQSRTRAETLEESMTSKDKFVATVSHELRTPLAAVIGFSELLRINGIDGLPPEERTEIIDTIAEQASDLADIVEDLLVVARADHGTLAAVAVPVDVTAQCRQVIERASLAPIPIRVTDEATNVRALADPGRIRQIIRNLLNNAASYGGSDIKIAINAVNDRVTLSVSDDGDGVPPDRTEQIFEAYQRAHEVGPTTGSLGLGLSVSRTLARHMGGDLRYHRAVGITTFELVLPRAITQDASERLPAQLVEA